MPRTVEHIVATHQAAAALRTAGKNIWPDRVSIKPILHEDPQNKTPEHISDVSVRIGKLLRRKAPPRFFDMSHPDYSFSFVDVVEAMEACTVEALAEDLANGVEAVDMLNGWLDEIYDWADNNRVWLGA